MGEQQLLRRILRIAVRETDPASARAKAILSWVEDHRATLGLSSDAQANERTRKKRARKARTKHARRHAWARLAECVFAPDGPALEAPAPLAIAARLAALLALAPDEARLLGIAVAFDRVPRITSLVRLLRTHRMSPATLAAELSGVKAVEKSAALKLGLIEVVSARDGLLDLWLANATQRVLDRAPSAEDDLIECLVGTHRPANLTLSDFAERAETVDLVRRIVSGALEARAKGINILLHGPPGVGKTELAAVITETAGARLYGVGEVDDYGDEPNRFERVTALKLAQRTLAKRRNAVLLFDEMEDLIGAAEWSGGRGAGRPSGSKVFVNRMLETNPVPTIWTTNGIETIDPAYLRRMSYVLRMDIPGAAVRRRVIDRIAETEGLALSEPTAERMSAAAPEAVTVARSAIRAVHLAGGLETDLPAVADALVAGVRHGHPARGGSASSHPLDLALYETREPIADLLAKLTRPGAPLDFSLLLMGPPGTGKTALAHHLARALDRPLEIKRASDLLSKWIGESEKQIAQAFVDAAEKGHMLLFDEIDSLLFDRAGATRRWEVSQVNELLTWMDQHPMPFLAATNHATTLDPAAMRRFVFKIALDTLPAEKAAHAFRLYFGADPPATLREVDGLTPGDFAVVARQLRFTTPAPSGSEITALLAAEAGSRQRGGEPIGFRARGR